MHKSTIETSPAKVNLFLQVLGKRTDGYHELATLMQAIDLQDELTFEPGGEGIRVECSDADLPGGASNIAFKAAKVFFDHVSDHPGVRIFIEKRIPVAAGLGGGSSNAATVLKTLNNLFGYGIGQSELLELAAKIGSDVPFFLFGSAAWAFGRGERLVDAPNLPPLWLVLINPRFAVSTREVYEGLNLKPKISLTKEGIKFNIPEFSSSVEDVVSGFRNDLERVTLTLHPVLADLKKRLLKHGALGSLMSGSGPTVFGVFAEEKDALRAAAALAREGSWSVFAVRSL